MDKNTEKEYEGKSLEEVENKEDRMILEIIRRLDEEYAFGHLQLHENLGNVLKIENWCKIKFGDKEKWERRLPSCEAEDEEEKKIGTALGNLRRKLETYEGKSLEKVENEEDRMILEIIRRLDEEYAFGHFQLHENLGNTLKIENWCKENFGDKEKWERKLPSKGSEDEKEKKLGSALGSLRRKLKEYEGKSLEEVKNEEDRKILEIIRRLDEEYNPRKVNNPPANQYSYKNARPREIRTVPSKRKRFDDEQNFKIYFLRLKLDPQKNNKFQEKYPKAEPSNTIDDDIIDQKIKEHFNENISPVKAQKLKIINKNNTML